MNNLEGTSVVVTGGSKGIGKIIAKDLFDNGASVLICSRNQDDIDLVCKEIDPEEKRLFGFKTDVSKMDDCRKLIDFAVNKFGKVDVLINNAGIIGEASKFEEADLNLWEDVLKTNFLGTIYCVHAVLPFMKKLGKGKIINFSGAGVGSIKSMPNFSAYYSSKIAIAGFSETISSELDSSGIQINSISPGAISTNITEHVLSQNPEKVGKNIYKQMQEIKNEDQDSVKYVTQMIRFLCSSKSNHVTGRLISARWDSIESLENIENENNFYKLRRIDNHFFYGK